MMTLMLALMGWSLTAWAQRGQQCKVVTDSMRSEVLGTWRTFTVCLPAGFDEEPDTHYPILYLLHGMGDNNYCWTQRGHLKEVMDPLVATGEACRMVVVTPDAGGDLRQGYWNGYFNMTGWAYEDFFYNEFVPYVEKTYRAGGDKQRRAIAGLSMGGGGTTSYAQRHPDMFCAAYAMSALMNIPEGMEDPSPDPTDKMSLLTNSVIEKSCVKYVQEADENRKKALRTVQWFVDCGDDDFLLDRNIEFVQAMHRAFIPVQFRVRDGGHTWEYWHSALYTCLPFVSRCFAH